LRGESHDERSASAQADRPFRRAAGIPLSDAETVFRTLAAATGPHLKRLPDGETGIRKTWIRFLQQVLADNPAIEVAWAALPGGDTGGEDDPQPLLDLRPVLANRNVLALIVGYAAAIWGCVGLRQWIVVFLTFCAGDQAADPAQAWLILVVGAVINFGKLLARHCGLCCQ
jgi:hypothetical protein